MNFVRFGPQAYGIVPKDGDDGYNIGYMTVGTVLALGPEASGYSVGQRVLTGGYHTSHWLVDPATPSGHILPIPKGVSDDAAGFAMLGDVALHGVRRAGLQIDGSVAVFGMGMVGQLTLQLARLSGSHPLIAVDLDPEQYRMAYDVVCNATLWFVHHHLFDLARRPRFDTRWRAAWDAYRAMNLAFAEVVVAEAPRDAVVLVQDYHLMLLAPFIRANRPDLATARKELKLDKS